MSNCLIGQPAALPPANQFGGKYSVTKNMFVFTGGKKYLPGKDTDYDRKNDLR